MVPFPTIKSKESFLSPLTHRHRYKHPNLPVFCETRVYVRAGLPERSTRWMNKKMMDLPHLHHNQRQLTSQCRNARPPPAIHRRICLWDISDFSSFPSAVLHHYYFFLFARGWSSGELWGTSLPRFNVVLRLTQKEKKRCWIH